MELTKEHFDQVVGGLASKKDLDNLEQRLKTHAEDLQSELARMVADGFGDVQKRLDLQQQLQAHDLKFQKLEEALHIKL